MSKLISIHDRWEETPYFRFVSNDSDEIREIEDLAHAKGLRISVSVLSTAVQARGWLREL